LTRCTLHAPAYDIHALTGGLEPSTGRAPTSCPLRRPRYDPRVMDTWPPPGPQNRPPLLEHVRDVWTLHGIQSNVTAAIWRNDFGLELRVEHGGELIESRLSRFGEAPLLLIADAHLIEQGWFE